MLCANNFFLDGKKRFLFPSIMKIYQKIFAVTFLYANINSITIHNSLSGKENNHYGNQEESQKENSQKKISTLSILLNKTL
jgi:hypothetical protein